MKRQESKRLSSKKSPSPKETADDKNYLPEGFEDLRILSAQVYALLMVSSTHDFPLWPEEVRNYYLWTMTDLALKLRDEIQGMVDRSTPRPIKLRLKEYKKMEEKKKAA